MRDAASSGLEHSLIWLSLITALHFSRDFNRAFAVLLRTWAAARFADYRCERLRESSRRTGRTTEHIVSPGVPAQAARSRGCPNQCPARPRRTSCAQEGARLLVTEIMYPILACSHLTNALPLHNTCDLEPSSVATRRKQLPSVLVEATKIPVEF